MRHLSAPVLLILVLVLLILACGCSIKGTPGNATVPVKNSSNVSHVNTTPTTVPTPTRVVLTEADQAFIKDSIESQSISIRNISTTLAMIRAGQYDNARTTAESAEKTLRVQYANLSERSVSPVLEPVKQEILDAISDEINASRKLRNVAISDSETMYGASRDYTDAADALFKDANVHLNNAQAKINKIANIS